jgi:hypothetical protein
MIGEAIREQSQQINKILRNVNTAMLSHCSKAVDVGEKAIVEYGYYRCHVCLCNCLIMEVKDYFLRHGTPSLLLLFCYSDY